VFDKFLNRYVINGDIITKSAIHIGTGNQELIPRAVDKECVKDINGYPFIPGSSLKGITRSFLERTLRANGIDVCTITELCLSNLSNNKERKETIKTTFGNEPSPEKMAEYIYTNICPVCSIFGGTNNGAKLMFRDAKLKDINYFNGFEIRNGITIDRDTNTSVPGHLYEVEVIPADTVFSFKAVAENVTQREWNYILIMLKALEEGYIEIGGMISRGFGVITLQNIKIEKIIGKDIFNSILKKQKLEVSLEDEIMRAGEIDV